MQRKPVKSVSRKAKKKSFSAVSHKRNLDNLKLLLSDPAIGKIVQEARSSIGLPLNGLPETSEAIVSWRNETSSRHMEVETCLTETAEKIIDQCDLPANYADSIKSYIIANIVHAPPLVFSEGPYHAGNIEKGPRKSVTITFYSKLTDDDLKDLKRYVNNVAGTFLPETRAFDEVDKKLMIEKFLSNREREDSSTGEKYQMLTSEIAAFVEEELRVKTTHTDVYENKRSLKKLRSKRFKRLGNSAL